MKCMMVSFVIQIGHSDQIGRLIENKLSTVYQIARVESAASVASIPRLTSLTGKRVRSGSVIYAGMIQYTESSIASI